MGDGERPVTSRRHVAPSMQPTGRLDPPFSLSLHFIFFSFFFFVLLLALFLFFSFPLLLWGMFRPSHQKKRETEQK